MLRMLWFTVDNKVRRVRIFTISGLRDGIYVENISLPTLQQCPLQEFFFVHFVVVYIANKTTRTYFVI